MIIDVDIDRDLYPFTSQWFDSSAGRIHYVDEGSGRPILFCHGAPTWSFLFRNVINALRETHRCIAVDHLGFGLSERPEEGFGYTVAEHSSALGELVDYLDLSDLVVVGHDWGGPIGLTALSHRPQRLTGIVATNTALWPIDALANRGFSRVMSTPFMQRRIVDENFLIEKVLLGRTGPPLTDVEADHYRRVQPHGARAGLAVMPTEIRAARPLLTELTRTARAAFGDVPTTAVWGMRDQVFPPRTCLPRLRSIFAELNLVPVSDAGHFVAEEKPNEMAAAIKRALGVS